MPHADYRRQAELCRQLALDCSEHAVAERFQLMAVDFTAEAEEAERSADSDDDVSALPDPHVIAGDDPTGDVDPD